MLISTQCNSVCFSPHEAPRSPPTTLLPGVAAHAERGHRRQSVSHGRALIQLNSSKPLSRGLSQSKVGPETI